MVPLIPDHRQNNNIGSLRVLHYKRNDGINDLSSDTKEPVWVCEHCGQLTAVPGKYPPNHFKFLGREMVLIEWCTNLGAIKKQRVKVMAIPLKIKGADGSPAMVIVAEED